MATMASAKAKYIRKMQNAKAKYDAAKGRAASNYGPGVARFLGRPASARVLSNYQAGISAAEYRPGDPDKWERNTIAGLTE